MIGIMLTADCYTVSSIEDKRITSKLKCTPAEFAFIVSSATMAWIGAAMPLVGWGFVFSMQNCLLLLALASAKIIEFYTSAILLKTVSAYELKAWLGISIVYCHAANGIDTAAQDSDKRRGGTEGDYRRYSKQNPQRRRLDSGGVCCHAKCIFVCDDSTGSACRIVSVQSCEKRADG